MFYANPFSYADRYRMCEHAYQRTRRDLLARSRELAPVLSRHGISVRMDVLNDARRRLPLRRRREHGAAATELLASTLDRLEGWMRAAART